MKKIILLTIIALAFLFIVGCKLKSPPVCGNDICESGENSFDCPVDCAFSPSCGDGICSPSNNENISSCPVDCASSASESSEESETTEEVVEEESEIEPIEIEIV